MGLINKGWYGMFFACGIWCLADISSVSPSSEKGSWSAFLWFHWSVIVQNTFVHCFPRPVNISVSSKMYGHFEWHTILVFVKHLFFKVFKTPFHKNCLRFHHLPSENNLWSLKPVSSESLSAIQILEHLWLSDLGMTLLFSRCCLVHI